MGRDTQISEAHRNFQVSLFFFGRGIPFGKLNWSVARMGKASIQYQEAVCSPYVSVYTVEKIELNEYYI